jgi:hypothetical protein
MKQLAFLTLDEKGDFVIDDELAIAPLAALGWNTSVVSWRQTRVPWRDYDAVIIRSTWDYWDDVAGFLEVLERIHNTTRLANSLALVRWNLQKTYLQELEAGGVPIVPTLWSERFDAASFAVLCGRLATDEIVIKPVVGANGVDAFRLPRDTGRESRPRANFARRRNAVRPFTRSCRKPPCCEWPSGLWPTSKHHCMPASTWSGKPTVVSLSWSSS